MKRKAREREVATYNLIIQFPRTLRILKWYLKGGEFLIFILHKDFR